MQWDVHTIAAFQHGFENLASLLFPDHNMRVHDELIAIIGPDLDLTGIHDGGGDFLYERLHVELKKESYEIYAEMEAALNKKPGRSSGLRGSE